jgi:hypothetical protein
MHTKMKRAPVRIKNEKNGFKMMSRIYDLLHYLEVHWDDVVGFELKDGYVYITVKEQ